MTRTPAVTGVDVVAAPKRAGFVVLRINCSNHVMSHPDGRRTVVPFHSGTDIKRGLLRKIIDDVDMTVAELIDLL